MMMTDTRWLFIL